MRFENSMGGGSITEQMGFRRFDGLDYRGFDNLDWSGFDNLDFRGFSDAENKWIQNTCQAKVMILPDDQKTAAYWECKSYYEKNPGEISTTTPKKFDWEKAGVAGGNVLDFITGLFGGDKSPSYGNYPVDYDINLGIQNEDEKKRKLKNGLILTGVVIVGALLAYKFLGKKTATAKA